MARVQRLVVAIAAIAIVSSCGGSAPTTEQALPEPAGDTLPAAPPAAEQPAPAEGPTDVVEPSAGALPTQAVELDQPAIWPAADVVFATPEEAASNFVSEVLGVDPVLGDFMAGDARSGEIQVFSPGEGASPTRTERGLLALRIIGPNDGWFVIAASSEGVTIESPQSLDQVPPGPLVVSGRGRGFEGTLVATAFGAGDADDVFDEVVFTGGGFASVEPFSATLDLSDAEPGEIVAVVVRGGVGLESDPGEFAALPVVIGDPLPETS